VAGSVLAQIEVFGKAGGIADTVVDGSEDCVLLQVEIGYLAEAGFEEAADSAGDALARPIHDGLARPVVSGSL